MKAVVFPMIFAGFVASPAFAVDEATTPDEIALVRELRPLSGTTFEAGFLQQMIAHQEAALDLAALVNERAANGELKELALKLIEQQRDELGKLNTWFNAMSSEMPDTQSTVLDNARQQIQQQLNHLQTLSGQEFDKAWTSAITRHIQESIAMLETVAQRTGRKDLQSFASDAIKARRDTLDHLQQIHRED